MERMAGSMPTSPTPPDEPPLSDTPTSLKIPAELERYSQWISEDWREHTPPTVDISSTSVRELNDAAIWTMYYYREHQLQPEELWEYLTEDFDRWTRDTYTKLEKFIIRELRDFLRRNGIYVKKRRGYSVAMAIDDTLSSPVFPTWMEDNEVKLQIPDDDVIEERPSTQLTRESVEFDTRRTRQRPLRPRTPELVDPSRLPSSIDIPRRLDLLSKSYHENEKFSGKQGDFLRTKLNLFTDKCQRLLRLLNRQNRHDNMSSIPIEHSAAANTLQTTEREYLI
ncbi:hypothetical protein VHEMI10303 [[Torrubiella] hemipterigena]|uniref:Uncharacterized protein n=1 Tax=[Torrubiella] hemipterigena TaxID=1531966 RepID=A0A0A1TCN1_9HYPO|nr:hypothetical protein VHEMI10303 [[Torrubiella] hemipterigena]